MLGSAMLPFFLGPRLARSDDFFGSSFAVFDRRSSFGCFGGFGWFFHFDFGCSVFGFGFGSGFFLNGF